MRYLVGAQSFAIIRVHLIGEAAKCEVLIAPILLEVCDQTQTQLNIEYTINKHIGLQLMQILKSSRNGSNAIILFR